MSQVTGIEGDPHTRGSQYENRESPGGTWKADHLAVERCRLYSGDLKANHTKGNPHPTPREWDRVCDRESGRWRFRSGLRTRGNN